MQRILARLALTFVALALSVSISTAEELGTLAGKWTLTRKNSDGQTVVHKLQFKDDKFTFRMMTEGGSTLLYAEGSAKVSTTANIKVVQLTGIRAGASDTEIQDVGEEYSAAFRVAGNTCYFAGGLDREREEEPRMDVYKKE